MKKNILAPILLILFASFLNCMSWNLTELSDDELLKKKNRNISYGWVAHDVRNFGFGLDYLRIEGVMVSHKHAPQAFVVEPGLRSVVCFFSTFGGRYKSEMMYNFEPNKFYKIEIVNKKYLTIKEMSFTEYAAATSRIGYLPKGILPQEF